MDKIINHIQAFLSLMIIFSIILHVFITMVDVEKYIKDRKKS